MDGYFHRVSAQTPTRFWINNVTRRQAGDAILAGAVGCTQNPSYVWKMLTDSEECEHALSALEDILPRFADDNEALMELQRALVSEIAGVFLPLYEKSGGREGYVSIQGDPFHEDFETIVRCARANCASGPNVMAKIPVTEEGLKAIEALAAERIPINATEVMAVRQALDVCEAYERATRGMKNPAPIYYSHITGIYDEYLKAQAEREHLGVSPDSLWQAGIAIAKKAHAMTKARHPSVGFIGGGARGLHHFTEMVGADAAITINWRGAADQLIEQNPPVVTRFARPASPAVIDELCEKMSDFRRGYFAHAIEPREYEQFGPVVLFRTSFETAWSSALKAVARRRKEMERSIRK